LERSEITFFDEDNILHIRTENKTFLWFLEKSGEHYKIKKNWTGHFDFQGKNGMIYETIKFKFV
jgi:hypothetical protein